MMEADGKSLETGLTRSMDLAAPSNQMTPLGVPSGIRWEMT